MFEITLPSSWSNKSDENADKGGVGGAVFMALTLSLVSFSCTGPIIGTVLVESVKVGGIEPLIGMLGFSSAFALPFTLFAFFPSWLKSLPKSGGWLNSSIADQTAHWGILDREVYLALWIVIFTLLGFYLLGKLKFSHDSDLPFLRVPRLVIAIFTFAFVVYLLPGMWGAPLRSLSGYLPPLSTMDFRIGDNIEEGGELCGKPQFADKLHLPHGLNGYFDYEEGMCCAKDLGKPVFIDFTGHGCVNCRELENNVWADPEILELLKNEFVIISLYIDEHTLDIQKPYISLFDGETKIQTIGQKNADIQKVWFNKNAQPYYVTLGVNEELLNLPIGYDVAEDKAGFLKFLKKSLSNYKK
jgi:thioredoxin-related protein